MKTEEPLVLAGDFNVIPAAPGSPQSSGWVNDALFKPNPREFSERCGGPKPAARTTGALRSV